MSRLVSVIVPVYNAEKYLSRCVDSILSQTYNDIEIILVDDGSTDASNLICAKYESENQNVKLVGKENGGISSARNEGLKIAKGDYIVFVDSDDCVDSSMIDICINTQIKTDADIVGFKWQSFSCDLPAVTYKTKPKVKNGKAVLPYFLEANRLYCAVRYLFSADIIKTNELQFDEKLRSGGEDQLFIYEYIKKCNKAAFIDYNGYFYYENDASVSSGVVKSNHYNDLNVRQYIYDDCSEKCKKIAKAHLIKGYIAFCAKAIKFGSECEEDIVTKYRKTIKRNLGSIIFSRYYGFKRKLAAVCISTSVSLTRKLLRGVRL